MLTVLFATRNGAATLPGVLEAYCRLEVPPGGWKLVVVDNSSTDNSAQIINAFQDRLPLTYVFEARAGKNSALNTGLSSVAGDLVVFTDDDAFPRPDWLIRWRHAADSHPAFGIFGGAVVARWQTAPPPWIVNWVPLAPTYTVSDPDLMEGPVHGHAVFGPNMAVRREIFQAGHRFDVSIGPDGSSTYPMGSETEFVLRLITQGTKACFIPEAVVDHFVRTSQMRAPWVFRRAVRFGRGQCRIHLQHPAEAPEVVWWLRRPAANAARWWGYPVPVLTQLFRKAGSGILALLTMNGRQLFLSVWGVCFISGYARESRAAYRRGSSRSQSK